MRKTRTNRRSLPETRRERDLQASEIRLNAEYVADIAREAPMPPGNPLLTPEATKM
jgi:hypothetical protein